MLRQERAQLLEEIEQLKRDLQGRLALTRAELDNGESDLREALEDYLAEPSRDNHRALAQAATNYRNAFQNCSLEEARRIGTRAI
jgi:hypothetical protein